MKIEKLSENKIRIVINSSDFELDNLNLDSIASLTLGKETFIINLLKRAKKEVGFETDGYKLLIETYSSNDDFLAFIITKYSSLENKKTTVNRKVPKTNENNYIFRFISFEDFCEFCNCISKIDDFNIKKLSKNIILYCYKNTYYLLFKNINNSYGNKKMFFIMLSEFSKPISFSYAFESKLIEYGNLIIEKNAIQKGIKFFT